MTHIWATILPKRNGTISQLSSVKALYTKFICMATQASPTGTIKTKNIFTIICLKLHLELQLHPLFFLSAFQSRTVIIYPFIQCQHKAENEICRIYRECSPHLFRADGDKIWEGGGLELLDLGRSYPAGLKGQ